MGLAGFLWSSVAMATLALPQIARAVVDDCKGVLVSDTLPVLVSSGSLLGHLQALQDIADAGNGSRRTGSRGHNQTLKYIKDHLSSQGYYVEVQHVRDLMQVKSDVTLLVDYPQESLGSIVLVPAGDCSLSMKSIAAGQAGADAIIVHESTQLSPSLGGHDNRHIPSARISNQVAGYLKNFETPLWTDIFEVSTQFEEVSRLECGDDDKTLLVGTHTDSVEGSAGINDNASGIASLLEVATQLAKFKTGSRVKFAFWTAAEPCLLGSRHYVSRAYKEELQKIRLYLDVNMVGSPNGALKIYDGNGTVYDEKPGPHGSGQAEATLAQGFDVQGAYYRRTEVSNRSDYAPFIEANVPFAGLFSGADGFKTEDEAGAFGGEAGLQYDSNYHLPEDDISNINMTALLMNTKALAHIVGTYGKSFDGFAPQGAAGQYAPAVKLLVMLSLAWVAYW
ncbi:leucine aminopeptidase 2 [Hypoxylon sp. NC1633]|nr:leucine aminopeptidase 2 [Hypoxylon sp. NC1633]